MKLHPCKHLDLDPENYAPQCELMTCPRYPGVRYWHRNAVPYAEAPRDVQFCKLYGRINGIYQCHTGEKSCYEPEEEEPV